jgi:hypothetical protein
MELAAKAAGMGHILVMPVSRAEVSYAVEEVDGGPLKAWNPLTDDGDALRLAVKLDLHVQCDFTEEESKVYVYGAFLGNGIEEDPGELDKYGATRRAIVRAAAEIGKAGAQ